MRFVYTHAARQERYSRPSGRVPPIGIPSASAFSVLVPRLRRPSSPLPKVIQSLRLKKPQPPDHTPPRPLMPAAHPCTPRPAAADPASCAAAPPRRSAARCRRPCSPGASPEPSTSRTSLRRSGHTLPPPLVARALALGAGLRALTVEVAQRGRARGLPYGPDPDLREDVRLDARVASAVAAE